MTNEVGTADNLEDLFTRIVRFVTGAATFTTPVFTGTGNGTLTELDTYPAAVTETWTIACTVAAVDGGTFSVTGSVSGVQASAVVGTRYNNAKVKFLLNDGGVDFIVGDQFVVTTVAGVMPELQRWTLLKQRRDNLAGFKTNYTEPTEVAARRTHHTYRYDARTLNIDTTVDSSDHCWYTTSSNINGTSYLQWQLRTPREIAKVHIRSPNYAYFVSTTINKWRLQYSDDGVSWTTALTQATLVSYGVAESKEWAVPASGNHTWWKLIVDFTGDSPTYAAIQSLLLLEADGTVANHFGSEAFLKAPGNAGTEEVFVGLRSEYDTTNGWHNLFLNGYTGFDSNEESWFKQPGALPGYGVPLQRCIPMVPCWDTSMPYWLSASGRSLRMGIKVSTSYESAYLGFVLPYSTPGQYPYPLLVSGSLCPLDASRGQAWRYSYASSRHGGPVAPGSESPDGENINGVNYHAAYLRDPSGTWLGYGNRGESNGEQIIGISQSLTPPYLLDDSFKSRRGMWPHCMNDQWGAGKRPYRECLGGGYILQPVILLQRIPTRMVVGELEGMYSVSGYANSSENTTTIDGKPAVIFQQCLRNTIHEFWAMSLD